MLLWPRERKHKESPSNVAVHHETSINDECRMEEHIISQNIVSRFFLSQVILLKIYLFLLIYVPIFPWFSFFFFWGFLLLPIPNNFYYSFLDPIDLIYLGRTQYKVQRISQIKKNAISRTYFLFWCTWPCRVPNSL